MRRRILFALLPLLFALLTALEVPLAQTYAARLTQDLFIDRIGDAQRYADRADVTLRNLAGPRSLQEELRSYERATGVRVTIVGIERNFEMRSGNRAPVSREARAALTRALAGGAPQAPATAWPWRREPIIVGMPIGQDSSAIGAVVLEVPTAAVRARVEHRIIVLVAAGIAVLLLTSALCALPLANWVLRPVQDLSKTAGRLATGDLTARASERSGPSELRGLAGAFNRMAENLAAALERQRAFAADASHELRNPLAALRLRIESLTGKVGGSGQRELALAVAESDRLSAIVDRLLELARAEATAAERVDFDVASLAAARAAFWKPALAAAGSDLRLDAGDEAWGNGSPDAVEYALDVLLDNARKFAAGAPVEIGVGVHAAHVEVRVRDRGAGLTAEDLQRVGERFWRSPRHRGIHGTGLGLATTRALIEGAGGSMQFTFAEPGLAVALRLPAATRRPPAGSSAPRPDAASGERSRSRAAD